MTSIYVTLEFWALIVSLAALGISLHAIVVSKRVARRAGVIDLHNVWSKVNELDPRNLVGPDVRNAISRRFPPNRREMSVARTGPKMWLRSPDLGSDRRPRRAGRRRPQLLCAVPTSDGDGEPPGQRTVSRTLDSAGYRPPDSARNLSRNRDI